MTTDRRDESDAAGERARDRVGVLAWVALAVSVVGLPLGVTAPPDSLTSRHYVALAVTALGFAGAALCLRHGARHEHERGRAVAILAVLVALLAGVAALRGYARIGPGR